MFDYVTSQSITINRYLLTFITDYYSMNHSLTHCNTAQLLFFLYISRPSCVS